MIVPHRPERFAQSIRDYIQNGVPLGGFLQAVFENNLSQAYMRADPISLTEIPGLVSWIYNDAPSDCWGSRDDVERWMKHHQDKRDARD